jgi:ElaB/YqjD/DUF883 family membrane-anchored ribosome-binding protein
MTDVTAEQTRIEHDLDVTRARMDSRLNDLQEQLSPGQVLNDLMAYFRGSEGGDFARSLMASVKANPLPAALTGIGLTWLMVGGSAPEKTPGAPMDGSAYDDIDIRVRSAADGVLRETGEEDNAYEERINDARGKVLGVVRDAQDTAASFGQRVQDTWDSARQKVTEKAHDLRDSAAGTADQAVHGAQAAQRAATDFVSTLGDNPVALGAIGFAIGALLGAVIPQSKEEENALGGLAGQAREAATGFAQQVADRGGEVAQKLVDTGMASAENHGLTGDKSVTDIVKEAGSGDLAENVKQVAHDVLETGEAALRGGTRHEETAVPTPSRAP